MAEDILTKMYGYLTEYGLQVLGAVLIFVIGKWLARFLSQLLEKTLIKSKVEATIAKFAKNIANIALLVFVVIAAMSRLGVDTTQFAVVMGAAALAVGLALQGSLANFASGFLMIIFRPFKVGDVIEAGGVLGKVEEIQIFTTVVNTPDNVRVIIPNGQVTGGNIKNYTANENRRVDLVIGVSYDDDLKKSREVIEGVLAADERILKEPAATVAVSGLGDSSVNFVVRPWVKPSDYWNVYFDVTAKVKVALEENGITIPYPQRDIHIKDSVVSGGVVK